MAKADHPSYTIGYPAEVPYWSLGFHQCRYGTNDIVEAAETVANVSLILGCQQACFPRVEQN